MDNKKCQGVGWHWSSGVEGEGDLGAASAKVLSRERWASSSDASRGTWVFGSGTSDTHGLEGSCGGRGISSEGLRGTWIGV